MISTIRHLRPRVRVSLSVQAQSYYHLWRYGYLTFELLCTVFGDSVDELGSDEEQKEPGGINDEESVAELDEIKNNDGEHAVG